MKELEKKLIIDNGFRKIFQTFFEKDGENGSVITMENSKNIDSICILPITKNKEVIYLSEYRFWPWEFQFWLPAWALENQEELIECAKRELLEETWFSPEKLIYLGKYNHNNYINWKIHLFLWIDCEEVGKQNMQDLEEIQVFKTSIENFEKMIDNNEIYCPWTEVAFIRAKKITNNFTNF